MNKASARQAAKELKRARKALLAARTLLEHELFEDCISRSYYAVLHAAKAALTITGVTARSHHGVRSMFGLHIVKTGKLEKVWAEILTAQQEDREIGDYEIGIEIEKDRASTRVDDAERFVQRIERFIQEME